MLAFLAALALGSAGVGNKADYKMTLRRDQKGVGVSWRWVLPIGILTYSGVVGVRRLGVNRSKVQSVSPYHWGS